MKYIIFILAILFLMNPMYSQIAETEPNDCFTQGLGIIGLCGSSSVIGTVGGVGDFDDVWVFDTSVVADVTITLVSGDIQVFILNGFGLDTFALCDEIQIGYVSPSVPIDTVSIVGAPNLHGMFIFSNDGSQNYELDFQFSQNFCGIVCPKDLIVSAPINEENYYASRSILSNGIIMDGDSVHFGASDSICLAPGFEVESGAIFQADNFGCN